MKEGKWNETKGKEKKVFNVNKSKEGRGERTV